MKNALEKSQINSDETDLAPKIFGFAALGVMATMFALMGFSMSIIIFLILVGYFVWRAVVRTEIGEIRGIFEFYLASNEILRDDERRWYGFEINKVIEQGHRILGLMPDPPPLVHFTLGALNFRAGNFQQAEKHLSFLLEDEKVDERNRLIASSELKSYVRILRKLEREPAEAPQTTAAIRALERARRHRAAILLTESRQKIKEALSAAKAKESLPAAAPEPVKPLLERLETLPQQSKIEASPKTEANNNVEIIHNEPPASKKSFIVDSNLKISNGSAANFSESNNGGAQKAEQSSQKPPPRVKPTGNAEQENSARLPISEVLRDIYD